MNRSRAENWHNRKRIIQKRLDMLSAGTPSWFVYSKRADLKFIGMLDNNNEMNRLLGNSGKRKTNTRKASASYRHKGGYGEAKKYKPRDKRQIEDMNLQEIEEHICYGLGHECCESCDSICPYR